MQVRFTSAAGAATNWTAGFYANQTTGAMTLSGPVFRDDLNATTATANQAFTLGGSNTDTNTVSGQIYSAAGKNGLLGLVKADAGTWVLTNSNNTYTGGTTVSGGVLRGTTNAAFGTGGITVSDTSATLDLSGSVTVANTITTAGTSPKVRSFSGSNTLTGNITLGVASTIEAASGATLALTSGTISGPFALTLDGAGAINLSRNVTAGSVAKTGAGTLTLSSNTASQITVALSISDGPLVVQNGNAITGAVTINASGKLVAPAVSSSVGPRMTLAATTLNANSTIQFGGTA